jgi:hypothetical protein
MTAAEKGPRDRSCRAFGLLAIFAATGCSVYEAGLLGDRGAGAGPDGGGAGWGGLDQGAAGAAGWGGTAIPGSGGAHPDAGTFDFFDARKWEDVISWGAGGAADAVAEPSRDWDGGNDVTATPHSEGGDASSGMSDVGSSPPTPDGGDAEAGRNHPVCDPGQCKLVFVSSSTVAADLGNALAFDDLCRRFAAARNLAGEWKAWVSDGAGSVTARMTRANMPHRLLDGHTIANDWSELVSGYLRHAIDVHEDATVASSPVEVWTGTSTTGEQAQSLTCANWTTTHGTAIVGQSDMITAAWTFARQQYCSATGVHLYCFEQ